MAKTKKKHLTKDAVLDIRRRAKKGEADDVLAEEYGVHLVTISNVRTHRTHKTAGGPVTRKGPPAVVTVPSAKKGRKKAKKARKKGKRKVVRRRRKKPDNELHRAAAVLQVLGDSWFEIKACHDLLGERIAKIDEVLHG